MSDTGSGELRELPVDLEWVAMMLEGDPTVNEGGYLDLTTGEVVPCSLTDPMIVGEDAAVDIEAEPDRWLRLRCLGSRDDWQDMAEFAATVTDPLVRDRLERALDGRGAFRRFRKVLHEAGLMSAWHSFSDERQQARARDYLADCGIRAVPER